MFLSIPSNCFPERMRSRWQILHAVTKSCLGYLLLRPRSMSQVRLRISVGSPLRLYADKSHPTYLPNSSAIQEARRQ